jgi:AraC-like DNA-binding protein
MAMQRDPIGEWREQYARSVANIDFEPLSGTRFRAAFTPIFEGLRIVRTALSPGAVFRDKDLVKDGSDDFHFVISQSRRLDATQCGRDLQIGRGDATLMRLCAPGTMGSREGIDAVVMVIPFAELKMRGAGIDGAVAKRVPRRAEPLRLLHGYVRSLQRSPPDASTKAYEAVRRHIIDLVALAVTPCGAVGESGLSAVAAARLDAILDHIGARFQESDLDVTSIARSQGISPRYLQRLIETTGTSFTARVNELRLQRAFTLLTDLRDGGRRISDIALQAGFSDISHSTGCSAAASAIRRAGYSRRKSSSRSCTPGGTNEPAGCHGGRNVSGHSRHFAKFATRSVVPTPLKSRLP